MPNTKSPKDKLEEMARAMRCFANGARTHGLMPISPVSIALMVTFYEPPSGNYPWLLKNEGKTMPRTRTDAKSHLAESRASTCYPCDNGRHGMCGIPNGAQVCTCVCSVKDDFSVGLTKPVVGVSGAVVGRRMADGRVFGYGPAGMPA